MSERDDIERVLQRITGDPLADSVRGAVRVAAVSEPGGRRRYQECTVTLVPLIDGIEHPAVRQEVVIDRRFWPTVGQLLPARISTSDPSAVDVTWDALRR